MGGGEPTLLGTFVGLETQDSLKREGGKRLRKGYAHNEKDQRSLPDRGEIPLGVRKGKRKTKPKPPIYD